MKSTGKCQLFNWHLKFRRFFKWKLWFINLNMLSVIKYNSDYSSNNETKKSCKMNLSKNISHDTRTKYFVLVIFHILPLTILKSCKTFVRWRHYSLLIYNMQRWATWLYLCRSVPQVCQYNYVEKYLQVDIIFPLHLRLPNGLLFPDFRSRFRFHFVPVPCLLSVVQYSHLSCPPLYVLRNFNIRSLLNVRGLLSLNYFLKLLINSSLRKI